MENPFELILEKLEQIQNDINELKSKQLEPSGHTYLDIDQTADLINLHKSTIYGLVSKRKIPYIKTGKKLCFVKQEIEDWLQSRRRKTIYEIENDVDEYLNKNRLF